MFVVKFFHYCQGDAHEQYSMLQRCNTNLHMLHKVAQAIATQPTQVLGMLHGDSLLEVWTDACRIQTGV